MNTPSSVQVRALRHDHSGFIARCLAAFVGRTRELAAVRVELAALQATGGYLIISGDPGQGKSSLIARLLQDDDPEQTVQHFIPLRPGPDHDVALLHNLLAQLILKHGLPSIYVATTSRAALRDYFAQALRTIAAAGRRELIMLDGLDQLAADADGACDLSFLPLEPPPGVVFVLGTRPHDALRRLELCKPTRTYWLPTLSRTDFDLVLHHRGVRDLDPALVNRCYTAMAGNALYLDLVAAELARLAGPPPDELIAQVLTRPGHLFALKLNRLHRPRPCWRMQRKPILGLLLAARDPLSPAAIGDLLGLTSAVCVAALADLDDLLTCDGLGRYALFHLRLVDFLREDAHHLERESHVTPADERAYHQRLADWCAAGDVALIWQPTDVALVAEQRAYARQSLVAHLVAAACYERLWQVLDAAAYCHAQMQADPSGRSMLRDLDAARDAVIAAGYQDRARSLVLLPRLYDYSLRRGRIASQADALPVDLLVLLVRVGRAQEAFSIAEVLSDPLGKSVVFLQLAQALRQAEQPSAATQLVARAQSLLGALWAESPQHLADQLQDEEHDHAAKLLDLLLSGDADVIEALCTVALQPFSPHVIAAATADVLHLIRLGLLVLRALVRTGMVPEMTASDLLDRRLDPAQMTRMQRTWTAVCLAVTTLDESESLIKQSLALINDLHSNALWLGLRTLAAQLLIERGQAEAGEALLLPMLDHLTRQVRLDDDDDLYSEISQTLVRIGRHNLLLGKLSTSRSLNDRLRRQAATALLELDHGTAALPLISMLENVITRCDMLLDAAEVLARTGHLAQVGSIYDEVLTTSDLVLAQGTRSDILLRLAEQRLAQGDGAAALAALRRIEALQPLNLMGQPPWPAWRVQTPPPSRGLRGALQYHGALLALARRLVEANQPVLVGAICAEVLALVAWLDAAEQAEALAQTLDVLGDLPPDAAVLGMTRDAQALLARITDHPRRTEVPHEVAQRLTKQGRFEAAKEVAAQIGNVWERGRAQRDLVQALIATNRRAEAAALAAQIDEPRQRASATCDLVDALIAIGQLAAAAALIVQINDGQHRAAAQFALVEALSATDHIDAAKALVAQMAAGHWRHSAQLALAQDLADRQRFTEAIAIVHALDDTDLDGMPLQSRGWRDKPIADAAGRAPALRVIVGLQIRHGQLAEAQAALALIDDRDDLAALRLEVATALVDGGHRAPAAALVATALAEVRAAADDAHRAEVRMSSIEHLAGRGHLRLAVALARLLATPFIRVRVLSSLAIELRRAGADAEAAVVTEEFLVLAQKLDETWLWEDLERDTIGDLVEQGRLADAVQLARSAPRVATTERPPDQEERINRRTVRLLDLAQALASCGYASEAGASIAEAAAIMLPVAASRVADQPLWRAAAMLVEQQRDADALVLARAITDPLLRAETLLLVLSSAPTAAGPALCREILGACAEERSQQQRAEGLRLKVADHLMRLQQFDTALTALPWADQTPLPMEQVVTCPLTGAGPLIGDPPTDKHRLRRQLIWVLASQGRTTEAQALVAGVMGYRQQIGEQRTLVLALTAQGHPSSALALAQGVVDDDDQRSNLLLTIGETLVTLGETTRAGDLVDGLAVTGLSAQARLVGLQCRLGHLSETQALAAMGRLPLVTQPAAAQILAEHGYAKAAGELLDAPAHGHGFQTGTHVAARLAVAQAFADQGHWEAALSELDRMPKQIKHDPLRHPPLAVGTLLSAPDRPLATAQHRNAALAALARIMVNQRKASQALVALARITDPGQQINALSEFIPRVIAHDEQTLALEYVQVLIRTTTLLDDAETAVDALLHANRCLVALGQLAEAATVAWAALDWVQHMRDPQAYAAQEVAIVEALLASTALQDALTVASRINDVDARVTALLAVAAADPPTSWAHLHALVQHHWRTAQTSADVLALLPLAQHLITEHPALGDALEVVIVASAQATGTSPLWG